jgi:hypothetical protein
MGVKQQTFTLSMREQMSECLLFIAHSEQLNQLYQWENE